MIKLRYIVLLVLGIGALTATAQLEYNVIHGPSNFMQLNEAGNDFEPVAINDGGQGYTFYNSYWDIESPWSVVSEGGTNIYTKLDLGKVSSFMDVFLVSPDLELSTELIYKYSQEIFGMANETVVPGCISKVELKLVQGKASDFHPDSLKTLSSLGFQIYRETGDAAFVVEDIVPQINGSHYFVLYVTYFGAYNGNTTGMSLGFKRNLITDNLFNGVNTATKNAFKVYPNPSNGLITIDDFRGELEVRDILGSVVYHVSNYNGQQVDLSHLQNGIYLLGNSQHYVRFIKR